MKNDLIFASLAGSYLYGTNRDDSDIDIRGVCFSTEESILGLGKFEQYMPGNKQAEEYSIGQFGIKSDDIVIYSISKFFRLCLNSNPNIIELLFCDNPLYRSSVWDTIIANRQLFLSTGVIATFSGYAYSQLVKIRNHKKWLDNPPVKPNPIDYGMSTKSDGGQDWSSINLKNNYSSKLKDFQSYTTWKKSRNPARAKLEEKHGFDTKHASHLYRLSLEAEELLTTGKITFPLREDTRGMVLDVLHGNVNYGEVVRSGESVKDKLLSIRTELPKNPDTRGVEKLLIKLQKGNLARL